MARRRAHVVGRMLSRGGEEAERAEAILIKSAVKHHGNREAMAKDLDISPVTLWRWCQAHNVDLDGAVLEALELAEDDKEEGDG